MVMKNTLKNLFKKQKIIFVIVFVIFALYALTMVYAVFWAFISSLKTNPEYLANKNSLPENWLFSNYIEAFTLLGNSGTSMPLMIINSLWLTAASSFIAVFVSAMTAYVIAKYEFPGRRIFYSLALVMMMVTVVGSLPAYYRIVHDLNLYDSPLFLITYAGGLGFNFIMLHAYFKNISWGYAEAAFIDGAGNFKVFVRIMLPQAIPSVMAIMLVQMIGGWNDYMTPLLYLPSFPTLASGLYTYEQVSLYNMDWPVYFAGLLISVVPVIIVFAVFQNTIMDNVMMGGLKE